MARIKELAYTQLKKTCDPASLKFKTTKELEPFNGTIGQQRGIKAMFGRFLPKCFLTELTFSDPPSSS